MSRATQAPLPPRPSTAVLRRIAAVGLLAVTAASIGVSLVPLAARSFWTAELASHFRLQYLAVLAVLLVPLAILRYRFWALAVAIAMAVTGAPTAGYWLDLLRNAASRENAAVAASASTFTVMTANLGPFRRAPRALLEIVRQEHPDVVVLTEFTPRDQSILAELDELYGHSYKMARRDPWGAALFSRLELPSAAQLSLGATKAIDARVRVPDGRLVRVIGVHLRSPTSPTSAAARNRQLQLLAAHRATVDEPLVITGDFNVTPYSPYLRDFLASTGLRDARRGFGFDVSWPASLPLLRIPIDHCIVSGELVVTGHRTLPAFGSDHHPVLAELALP